MNKTLKSSAESAKRDVLATAMVRVRLVRAWIAAATALVGLAAAFAALLELLQ